MSSQLRTTSLAIAAALLSCNALAQDASPYSPWRSKNPLGLALKNSAPGLTCPSGSWGCDRDAVVLFQSSETRQPWAVHLELSPAAGLPPERRIFRRPDGLDLSLVGRVPITSSFSIFARLGTPIGREPGWPGIEAGPSYSAGLSWDFSKRGSATVGVESFDLRAGTEPLRATSIGLQWRY